MATVELLSEKEPVESDGGCREDATDEIGNDGVIPRRK